MKRYGNIYSKIYEMDNLKLAHKRAKKDKSYYKEVKMIDANEEYYLKQIQEMLKNKTYYVTDEDYVMFEKLDRNKVREIYKLDYFPHRIIQHALLLQIEDTMLRNLINNTFSSIPKRGIHQAFQKLDNDIKSYPKETVYCLQMDVRKFYPSINHEINKQQYRKKFKDKDLLWLIDMLIDSLGERGIAIGSLFSQWDGNFNMSEFDHWIKEIKGVNFYYRYCDDLVILSGNKESLHELKNEIIQYLKEKLDLDIKGNHKVFPIAKQGLDFVGYRHFGSYVLLRKSISKKLIRKMRDIKKKVDSGNSISYSDYCSINSYKGWLKWCDGYNLYVKWIQPLELYAEQYYNKNIKTKKKRGNDNVKKFSEFGKTRATGEKIKIAEVVDKEIAVLGYSMGKSAFRKEDDMLTLEISFNGEERVIFTGSGVLIDQVQKYESEIPFLTTIKHIDNKFYSFT